MKVPPYLKPGTRVRKGQILGKSLKSMSNSPLHVHFGMKRGGKPVDLGKNPNIPFDIQPPVDPRGDQESPVTSPSQVDPSSTPAAVPESSGPVSMQGAASQTIEHHVRISVHDARVSVTKTASARRQAGPGMRGIG